ncbi:endonuclease exonuclease phosphatase [Echinococcus multilocularis]|uniref:Endonuclease exonuclease phosphatase n=1 Tax=Echinococcus multilocularis TaxID=6211 RepID=A0A068XXY6_ECHMU|nr:endonuclease exonuclease phosphatase [Echinococcus multilocularis]
MHVIYFRFPSRLRLISIRKMSYDYIKLHHPSCLFVSSSSDDINHFEFQLPFFPKLTLGLGTKPGRIFALKRPATEEFSSFATRLIENMNKYFDRSHKNSKASNPSVCLRAVDIKLDDDRWKPSDTLGSIFSASQPMQMQLCIEADTPKVIVFDVRLNPACVKSMKLDLTLFVGCPAFPAIAGENLDLGRSKFEWFVSAEAKLAAGPVWEGQEMVHEGFVFTPRPEHIGRFVRLRVLPFDAGGLPGVPFGEPELSALCSSETVPHLLPFLGQFIVSAGPITEAPPQNLICERFKAIASRIKGTNEFRLVCYNLLAFMYSGTESARTYFFRHCPPAYLDPKYRFPLLYRELLAYQADILCLQEVDTSHFQRRLFFLLQQAGKFEGCFLSKLLINVPSALSSLPPSDPVDSYPRKEEGVAIFFRRERFRLVKEVALDSLILHAEAEYEDLARAYHALAASGEVPLDLCMGARAHGVLVCLLECRYTGRRLLLACTHLYFHPKALKLRNIQCLTLRRFLLQLAWDLAVKEPLPIVLAADLNADPDSEPYQNLTGRVKDREVPGPVLEAAIPLPGGVYTNIVPGFKANLDVVLYATPDQQQACLRVAHAFPVPSEAAVLADGRSAQPAFPPLLPEAKGGLTLPNSQFPSDHLSLAVDFLLE